MPVFSMLELSAAGRYDHYTFAGFGIGKFTYNAGAEFRPAKTLLIRGAYGTGFRAPDLNYVFRGPGNTHTGGTDYYLCRQDDPGASFSDCQDGDFGRRRLPQPQERQSPAEAGDVDIDQRRCGLVAQPAIRHFGGLFPRLDEESGARPEHRQRASRRGGLPPGREWRDSPGPDLTDMHRRDRPREPLYQRRARRRRSKGSR